MAGFSGSVDDGSLPLLEEMIGEDVGLALIGGSRSCFQQVIVMEVPVGEVALLSVNFLEGLAEFFLTALL